MWWCFRSHLVLPCTNGHQNKPIFSCLCLWGGAFSHILYFSVQTGTNTNLDLVVYVYRVVLFLASCTSMYKQAPKQTYLKLFMFMGWGLLASCTLVYKQAPKQAYFELFKFMGWCFFSHLVLRFTNRHQNKPSFIYLCLWCGASTRILYFDVLTGTKTNLSIIVYVYGVVL